MTRPSDSSDLLMCEASLAAAPVAPLQQQQWQQQQSGVGGWWQVLPHHTRTLGRTCG